MAGLFAPGNAIPLGCGSVRAFQCGGREGLFEGDGIWKGQNTIDENILLELSKLDWPAGAECVDTLAERGDWPGIVQMLFTQRNLPIFVAMMLRALMLSAAMGQTMAKDSLLAAIMNPPAADQ